MNTTPTDPRAESLADKTATDFARSLDDLRGRPLRQLKPQRMLRTGDEILNRFGQVFSVIAFHPQGVRVATPLGTIAQYTWQQIAEFYELDEEQPAQPADCRGAEQKS